MVQQIYDMELVTEENIFDREAYDYFLLAPNIERRSRAAFLKLKENLNIDKTIIMDYKNFHSNISQEQEDLFYCDLGTPLSTAIREETDTAALRELTKVNIQKKDRIAFDITGFSIPNLYRIMMVLKNVIQVEHIDVFYTEPKFYIYEEGYFDAYHNKKKKERRCAPIQGYCNSGENEKEILVIFLGFDGGLAGQVYFSLAEEGQEILQTLAVNGFPSYTAKLKDVSLFNNEDFINKIGRENVRCAVANNPFDVYNLLCQILEDYRGTLLNLCTIGSKPMALGTCLFALDHLDEVKVTYPFYEKTQFDDKEEPGKIWRYGINLL